MLIFKRGDGKLLNFTGKLSAFPLRLAAPRGKKVIIKEGILVPGKDVVLNIFFHLLQITHKGPGGYGGIIEY